MTDQKIKQLLSEMIEYFGGTLPDPEQHPRVFKYYVTLFRYYKKV